MGNLLDHTTPYQLSNREGFKLWLAGISPHPKDFSATVTENPLFAPFCQCACMHQKRNVKLFPTVANYARQSVPSAIQKYKIKEDSQQFSYTLESRPGNLALQNPGRNSEGGFWKLPIQKTPYLNWKTGRQIFTNTDGAAGIQLASRGAFTGKRSSVIPADAIHTGVGRTLIDIWGGEI